MPSATSATSRLGLTVLQRNRKDAAVARSRHGPIPQFIQPMSRRLILAVRHRVHESGGFSDWEPDGEFWFTAYNARKPGMADG